MKALVIKKAGWLCGRVVAQKLYYESLGRGMGFIDSINIAQLLFPHSNPGPNRASRPFFEILLVNQTPTTNENAKIFLHFYKSFCN